MSAASLFPSYSAAVSPISLSHDKENQQLQQKQQRQQLRLRSKQRTTTLDSSFSPSHSPSKTFISSPSTVRRRGLPYTRPSSPIQRENAASPRPLQLPAKQQYQPCLLSPRIFTENSNSQQQQQLYTFSSDSVRGNASKSFVAVDKGVKRQSAVLQDQQKRAYLPLKLPRPIDIPQVELGTEFIAGETVPITFILEKLSRLGPSLLEAASHSYLTQLTPARPLPSALEYGHTPSGADGVVPPDYVLAVSQDLPSSPPNHQHTGILLPIHSIIYRAQCAYFPRIDFNSHRDLTSASSSTTTQLPVLRVKIPSPSTLPLLNAYLYTQRPDTLLFALLDPPSSSSSSSIPKARSDLAHYMAERMTAGEVLSRIQTVHGVWENVCSLGMGEDMVWKALDTAWDVLIASISLLQARARVESIHHRLPTVACRQ